MNEFERLLTQGMADEPPSPDEDFVRGVARAVAAEERARIVRLAIITCIALCLAVAFGFGLAASWKAVAAVWSSPPMPQPFVACGVAVLSAILLLPLMRTRE
ncbi:MAG TPA: hypothetical protein PKE27_11550 [Povalibacter sp.]|uniref:hypothetical protein n=1 Tax=Povalibacter sp. TaxID=1962978 RepID=UPI002D0F5A6E|nr:hypothetical protein [Povalibacter sp.]HMN45205.1 hypothetical protein [Povalibacter sp.]